jgi:glycosyltransferase involved in cell wall biosynthesis
VQNPKKVLIFSVTYYPKLVGGDVVAVKEITDRLSPKEYEFHLITIRFDKNLPKEEKIGNVFVHRLGFVGEMKESTDSLCFPLHYNKYLYTFTGAWKAIRLHKKHGFSLMWGITANYAGFAALFFKLLRPKIPFLLTLQEGDPFAHYKKRVSILYPLHKMIFKKADNIQTISNYLAEWAKKMGFKNEPKVIPNGVDTKLFTQEVSFDERSKIRTDLGLDKEDVALVTTSRLVIKNGLADVIKALPNLGENIKFVIFGEGYLEQKLKLEARSLNLEDRVIFKGFVSHGEMPKYLKACDIFIRPSLSEGFGNSFIEAMAARLPVIATRVGGIADFFRRWRDWLCM